MLRGERRLPLSLTRRQSTEFDIDRDYVSRIVGTGGAGANKLRTSLGVKIDFADGNDDKDKFVDKSGKNKKPSGQKTHVTVSQPVIQPSSWLTFRVDHRSQGERRGGQEAHSRSGRPHGESICI
jgi:hypothetical protein